MALTKITSNIITDGAITTDDLATATITSISGSGNQSSSSLASRVTVTEASSSNINQDVKSSASPTFAGGTVTGDFSVGGILTAQEFHTEFESASIIYTSGSNKFGDSSDDVHHMSGSLRITGSGDHYIQTGNVGIGTTSPNTTLTLSDGTDEFDFGVTTNQLMIKSVTSDGSDDQRIIIDAGNGGQSSTRGAYIALSGNEASSEAGNAIYQVGNITGASHIFRISGGVDGVTIDNSGNVGIGTNNPSNKLHIFSSTGGVDTILRIECDASNASPSLFLDAATDRDSGIQFRENNTLKAQIYNDASNDALVLTDGANSGLMHLTGSNVGIGTTSPSGTLEVNNSTSTNKILLTHSTTDHMGMLIGTNGAGITVEDNNYFAIWHQDYTNRGTETGLTERMRIDSNGHTRFGSSGDGFDSAWADGTYGNTEVAIDGGGGYGVLHFRGDGAGSTATRFSIGVGDDKFYLAYDDVDARHNIVVNGSGNVGIGTSTPGEKIDVYDGDIRVSSARGIRGPGGTEQIRFNTSNGVQVNSGNAERVRFKTDGSIMHNGTGTNVGMELYKHTSGSSQNLLFTVTLNDASSLYHLVVCEIIIAHIGNANPRLISQYIWEIENHSSYSAPSTQVPINLGGDDQSITRGAPSENVATFQINGQGGSTTNIGAYFRVVSGVTGVSSLT